MCLIGQVAACVCVCVCVCERVSFKGFSDHHVREQVVLRLDLWRQV